MTNHEGKPILGDAELVAEFAILFPQGWAGADVMGELAPDGWAASPFKPIFHPTVEQVHEETVRIQRNMAGLLKKDAESAPGPTFEDTKASYVEGAVEPERECQELLGCCLWDVFADNHEVTAADGRLLELGSFRAAGGFLADVLNTQGGPPPPPKPPEMTSYLTDMFAKAGSSPESAEFMQQLMKEMIGDGGYTYMDFHMGTQMVGHRADLVPVYKMIFRRLRSRGMDWKYAFPRIHLVDMRPLKKMLDDKERGDEPEWEGYDPSAAFEEEQEEMEHDRDVSEMRESLDEGYRESVSAALDSEPPATVRAYVAVYGDFPEGWPPEMP